MEEGEYGDEIVGRRLKVMKRSWWFRDDNRYPCE